jgi:hypothetical protein
MHDAHLQCTFLRRCWATCIITYIIKLINWPILQERHSPDYQSALPSPLTREDPVRVRKEEEDTAQATYTNKAPHSTRIPSVPRTYCLETLCVKSIYVET